MVNTKIYYSQIQDRRIKAFFFCNDLTIPRATCLNIENTFFLPVKFKNTDLYLDTFSCQERSLQTELKL